MHGNMNVKCRVPTCACWIADDTRDGVVLFFLAHKISSAFPSKVLLSSSRNVTVLSGLSGLIRKSATILFENKAEYWQVGEFLHLVACVCRKTKICKDL